MKKLIVFLAMLTLGVSRCSAMQEWFQENYPAFAQAIKEKKYNAKDEDGKTIEGVINLKGVIGSKFGEKYHVKNLEELIKAGVFNDVKELNLASNKLKEIPDITSLQSLEKLELNDNPLTVRTLKSLLENIKKLPNLEYVGLKKCGISDEDKIEILERIAQINKKRKSNKKLYVALEDLIVNISMHIDHSENITDEKTGAITQTLAEAREANNSVMLVGAHPLLNFMQRADKDNEYFRNTSFNNDTHLLYQIKGFRYFIVVPKNLAKKLTFLVDIEKGLLEDFTNLLPEKNDASWPRYQACSEKVKEIRDSNASKDLALCLSSILRNKYEKNTLQAYKDNLGKTQNEKASQESYEQYMAKENMGTPIKYIVYMVGHGQPGTDIAGLSIANFQEVLKVLDGEWYIRSHLLMKE